jgi:thiol-disulfide isomerase/thioredoxin
MKASSHTLPAAAVPAESRQLSRQTQVLVAVLAAASLAVLFWPRGDGTREAPGGFLIDAGGRPVPVAGRMAPVTLVHFWATWCPPCMTEIPSLDRLSDDLGEYRGDFTILMVAVNDDMERVATFVGERMSSVLYDPSWEVAHRYGTRKLPETYLVVRGNVEERWIGAQDWNDPKIRRRILEAVDGLRTGQEQAPGAEQVSGARAEARPEARG